MTATSCREGKNKDYTGRWRDSVVRKGCILWCYDEENWRILLYKVNDMWSLSKKLSQSSETTPRFVVVCARWTVRVIISEWWVQPRGVLYWYQLCPVMVEYQVVDLHPRRDVRKVVLYLVGNVGGGCREKTGRFGISSISVISVDMRYDHWEQQFNIIGEQEWTKYWPLRDSSNDALRWWNWIFQAICDRIDPVYTIKT